jgi:hypothetical protein
MLLSILLAFASQTAGELPHPERPRDPFVFRSVLDRHPRMVTLALSKEMWVAYDATHCSLYRAWKGGVHFDGAVYTTEHGPQPTSDGATYCEGSTGDVWRAEIRGATVAAKAVWRGYQLTDGAATLCFDLVLPDGRTIAVRETPEFVRPPDSPPSDALQIYDDSAGLASWSRSLGFSRRFTAVGIPKGVEISMLVREGDAIGRVQDPLLSEVALEGILPRVQLTEDRPHAELTLFFAPREESAPAEAPASPKTKGGVRR